MDVKTRIQQRFRETGSPAQVPKARGGPFRATLCPDGVEVDNLGNSPLLPWAVFEETVALLEERGGSARYGDAMDCRLGDPNLGLDTIEGRIACKVYGKARGSSVFRRSAPIAGILVWVGVCERVQGGLALVGARVEQDAVEHSASSNYHTALADVDPQAYMRYYDYQPELTSHLDSLEDRPFDQAMVNEIVLWKVDRYAQLPADLLARLNDLQALQSGEHRQAEPTLRELLGVRGVDISMASTLLRFRNPRVFQIIDRHAYRALYGEDCPLYAGMSEDRKVALYWEYLDAIWKLCTSKQLEFSLADRFLYTLDRQHNGKL